MKSLSLHLLAKLVFIGFIDSHFQLDYKYLNIPMSNDLFEDIQCFYEKHFFSYVKNPERNSMLLFKTRQFFN